MPSKIEWTEETWNPVTGCTKVSPGCDNCYAERMAKRLKGMGVKGYENGFEVTCHPDRLEAPLHWRKPRVVFVCSMGDLFHEDVPFEFIDQVYAVMALSPQHTFLVLTKRAERMAEYCVELSAHKRSLCGAATVMADSVVGGMIVATRLKEGQLTNVWHGVTAEDQQRADMRIPRLLEVPGKRFLSFEPMVGPINLNHQYFHEGVTCDWCGGFTGDKGHDCYEPGPGYHAVILGGESGPGARPMHPGWARSVRDQCADDGVPFFFKQWGEYVHFMQQSEQLYGREKATVQTWQRREHTIDGEKYLKVGKRLAGRLLDGCEHNDLPWGGDA